MHGEPRRKSGSKTTRKRLNPRKTGLFVKYQIHPLVVERAYLATTACMAQVIFSKIIIPGYSHLISPDFPKKTQFLESYSHRWITSKQRKLGTAYAER
jgi:hypothetical protein